MTYEIKLNGCNPVPLAGYLKALGVLRIISQQVDPKAKGWWANEVFVLESKITKQGLSTFFQEDYQPTPIVGPWGARSGFYPEPSEKAAREALDAIAASKLDRLSPFQNAIAKTKRILESYGIKEKPEPGESKAAFLRLLRANLPDSLLDWLDCVCVVLGDGAAYPPLLGSGGSEGSGSYTSAFSRAVVDVLVKRKHDHALGSAFFDCLESDTGSSLTPGHFSPGESGGPNAGTGYTGQGTLNPWTLLLLLEGAIAFASSSSKRTGSHADAAASYPFSVTASGFGYASGDLSDEGSRRRELWLPIWKEPMSFPEITHLMSQGRATIDGRPATTSVDFARAISSLGIDTGIAQFQRYGFQLRNGDRSNFAISLGEYTVGNSATVGSVRVLDQHNWLGEMRENATAKHAPPAATSALRRIETSLLDLCRNRNSNAVSQLLSALGEAETAIAASPDLRKKVLPVPLLPPEWIAAAYGECDSTQRMDESMVARSFRMAASLASLGFSTGFQANNQQRPDPVCPFRCHVAPIRSDAFHRKDNSRAMWAEHANDPSLVWAEGSLVQNLTRVLNRRMIDAIRLGDKNLHAPFHGKCPALLPDIFRFIEGDVDDSLIESFAKGLMLVDWAKVNKTHIPWRPDQSYPNANDPFPSAAYCLLKLCLLPHPIPVGDGEVEIKLAPQIARRASMGHLTEATQLAARRLRASGLKPAIEQVHNHDIDVATRTAAALVFPVSSKTSTIRFVRDRVMFREAASKDFDNATTK